MKLTDNQRGQIYQAIGQASMCWSPLPGKQVFDSKQAKDIAERLIKELELSVTITATDTGRT